MGSSFFSNQDFSAKGVVKGLVCVWGSALDHSLGSKVLVRKKKTIQRSRFKHRDTLGMGFSLGYLVYSRAKYTGQN